MSILRYINQQLGADANGCPLPRSRGECAFIGERSRDDEFVFYEAFLYLWDNRLTDASLIARWFQGVGASYIYILHMLYDEENGDRDGRTVDGARAWVVHFALPNTSQLTLNEHNITKVTAPKDNDKRSGGGIDQ